MIIKNIKFEEGLFMVAGLGMLIALPLLKIESYIIWYIAKIFYFAGVGIFIYKVAARKY